MNEDEKDDIVYAVRTTHPVYIYLFGEENHGDYKIYHIPKTVFDDVVALWKEGRIKFSPAKEREMKEVALHHETYGSAHYKGSWLSDFINKLHRACRDDYGEK